LGSYFEGVGVASSGAADLGNSAAIPRETTALVLFPDEYPNAGVEKFVLSLRRARPKLFILLVTSAPQNLGASVAPDGRTTPPVVLPKPAFGWTILDAIRAAVDLPDDGGT